MADGTHIEWTDATWNPVTGCKVVSPGCTNCYAMRLAGTRMKHHPSRAGLTQDSKAGPVWTGEVRFNEQWLDQPLRWAKPRRIFVCAHGDLFAEGVPDAWIDRVFAVMALAPQHTFQVLTKRAQRMRDYLTAGGIEDRIDQHMNHLAPTHWCARELENDLPLPNVWLGISVEDQSRADERIPLLLDTPAAKRFISAEPLLGPIDLRWAVSQHRIDIAAGFLRRGLFSPGMETLRPLDWVIAGGESGPGARPMHPDWSRSLRDQCEAAGVAFHFKQWGEWAPGNAFGVVQHGPVTTRTGNVEDWRRQYVVCADRADRLDAYGFTEHGTNLVFNVGKKRAGRLLDGREHNGIPG